MHHDAELVLDSLGYIEPMQLSVQQPEVHNVQYRKYITYRNEERATITGDIHKVVKIVTWFQKYTCGQTDTHTHTDRRAHRSTVHLYRGGVITKKKKIAKALSQLKNPVQVLAMKVVLTEEVNPLRSKGFMKQANFYMTFTSFLRVFNSCKHQTQLVRKHAQDSDVARDQNRNVDHISYDLAIVC